MCTAFVNLTTPGYFLNKTRATQDGDGSLLDHSMIVYGGGISDGNRHDHHDLPLLLAGRANGRIEPGRHVTYPPDTPMANLLVTMLDHLGVPGETLGDSTGALPSLSNV